MIIFIVVCALAVIFVLAFLFDQLLNISDQPLVFRVKRWLGGRFLRNMSPCKVCNGTAWHGAADGFDFKTCSRCGGLSHECSQAQRRVLGAIAWALAVSAWLVVAAVAAGVIWVMK